MNKFWHRLALSLRDLVYPRLCLHCHESIGGNLQHLCGDCLELLEHINPVERCPYCFHADYVIGKPACGSCRKRDPILYRCAAAFDYQGPAASLIRQFKYGDQPYLAKSLAAMMTQQFIALDWPMPDLIVPIPISRSRWFTRGYNQSLLLAQHLSEFLSRPVADILKRRSGDYSQAGLSRAARLRLKDEGFSVKNSNLIADRTILLIDDVMTTGSTLRCCGSLLQTYGPTKIYALTACRAE